MLRPEYFTIQLNVALDFERMERRYARDSTPILLTTIYLSYERLRDTYANANAYVMPSNEGFGLIQLEAMSCGTPVIGLDYGAGKEFINDRNGFLAPVENMSVSKDLNALPTVEDELTAPSANNLRCLMREAFEKPAETRGKGEQARRDCEAR